LAAVLSYADEDQSSSPTIADAGPLYLIDFPNGKPSAARLMDAHNGGWREAFVVGDFRDVLSPQWNSLLVTDRAEHRERKRANAKRILEEGFDNLLDNAGKPPGLMTDLDGSETLPGGLDPVAFKGLRGRTRGQYTEGQTKVDPLNWALACLGGALARRSVYQRNAGYFVVYPVPELVRWADFREVRKETQGERLNYLSVQNAAAHYSVLLAERLRRLAASGLAHASRYSNLVYFSLFKTGNQWKPGNAGRLNLQPLLDLALQRPDEAEGVFKVWEYLFRRGSVQGNEDLALAISELIMHPTLRSYERHVRVLARHIAQGAKVEYQYREQTLREVTSLVQA